MPEIDMTNYVLKEQIADEQVKELSVKRYFYLASFICAPVAMVINHAQPTIASALITLLIFAQAWLYWTTDAKITYLCERYGKGLWKVTTIQNLIKRNKAL